MASEFDDFRRSGLENVHHLLVFRVVGDKAVNQSVVRIGRGKDRRLHSLPDVVVDDLALGVNEAFLVRSTTHKLIHRTDGDTVVLDELHLLQAHIPRVLGGLLRGIELQRSRAVRQFADTFLDVCIVHYAHEDRLAHLLDRAAADAEFLQCLGQFLLVLRCLDLAIGFLQARDTAVACDRSGALYFRISEVCIETAVNSVRRHHIARLNQGIAHRGAVTVRVRDCDFLTENGRGVFRQISDHGRTFAECCAVAQAIEVRGLGDLLHLQAAFFTASVAILNGLKHTLIHARRLTFHGCGRSFSLGLFRRFSCGSGAGTSGAEKAETRAHEGGRRKTDRIEGIVLFGDNRIVSVIQDKLNRRLLGDVGRRIDHSAEGRRLQITRAQRRRERHTDGVSHARDEACLGRGLGIHTLILELVFLIASEVSTE